MLIYIVTPRNIPVGVVMPTNIYLQTIGYVANVHVYVDQWSSAAMYIQIYRGKKKICDSFISLVSVS